MTDFLDDERRRLAYADRSPTLEQAEESRGFRAHDSSRHCRDRSCDYEVGGRWSCEYPPICTPPLADGTGRHSRKEMEQATGTQTIAGVQFSSVPALCAAFEQLLSASAAYLWTWRPDREHCSGPQMEAYRELRRLVAGAGKDVP